jgi:hypothetical protein
MKPLLSDPAAVRDIDFFVVAAVFAVPSVFLHPLKDWLSTLLIIGSQNADVLRLNEYAATELGCHHRVGVAPGATHLFPEPGALQEVAGLAARWFGQYLNNQKPNKTTVQPVD